MFFSIVRTGLFVVLSMLTLVAYADSAIKIDQAWARETPPGVSNGAAFMTIENTVDVPDQLLGASGDVASQIELHTHIHEGGVMMMRKVESIDIPAQGSIALQPGGLHIMLIGLTKPLAEGDQFDLTLHFESAGEIPLQVNVAKGK